MGYEPVPRECGPLDTEGHFNHAAFRPDVGDWSFCPCRCDEPDRYEACAGPMCRRCWGYVGAPQFAMLVICKAREAGITFHVTHRVKLSWLLMGFGDE